MTATIQRTPALPRLTISNGTIEALKWLALVLMTIDHIDKYVFHESVKPMFYLGRIAMPLFAFVLAFNLARPGTLERGVYLRVIPRLALFGVIACAPYIALGGVIAGWYPLNILFMLLSATAILYFLDKGGSLNFFFAVLVFAFGGALVEFWYPAIIMTVAASAYVRRPSWPALAMWILSAGLLHFINGNSWALVSLPIIFAAPYINLNMPRIRTFFYVYYPLHLGCLWIFIRFFKT